MNPNSPTQSSLAQLIENVAVRLAESDAFYGHGTDNPEDEARWLVMGSLGLDFDSSEEELARAPSVEELVLVNSRTEQRLTTKLPTAYLLGEAWFAGERYFVTEDTLIPRSPFAELIFAKFDHWLEGRQPARMLDLCSGSGCIGIAAALVFPDSVVELGELCPEAITVAKRNIERHGLSDRVTAIESDLFTNLTGRYNLIVSNPPYVPTFEYESLPEEYYREPKLGLEAGEDGLALVIPMLQQAPDYLEDGGWLFVEVGNTEEFLAECFPEIPFLWIDFAHGGSGVFALSKQQLIEAQPYLAAVEL
jgi:ribosomal protein L3 glutamine methyltransferase